MPLKILVSAFVALAVAGCSTNFSTTVDELGDANPIPPVDGKVENIQVFHSSDDLLELGKLHFKNGNFGKAENNFRRAVEVTPKDAEAWIGLAASYDRLRRFDQADRAYKVAVQLVGRNEIVLNNMGYSHMLRGDIKTARKLFLEAHERKFDNQHIRNNIDLLNSSGRYVKRLKG